MTATAARGCGAALLLVLAAGCREPAFVHRIQVRAAPGAALDLGELRWRGPVRASSAPDVFGVALEVARVGDRARLVLDHPDACPVEITLTAADTGALEIELAPRIEVTDQLQVGFAASFELRARHRCPPPSPPSALRWTQLAGPQVELEIAADGAVVRGRTHALRDLRPDPLPWGIVPLSPATRGEYLFEIAAVDGARATARVTAAARASGVPSVGLGHRLVLGGSGWQIVQRPQGGAAELQPGAGAPVLIPDRQGRWLLRDGDGRRLMIRVGRYDETPLDCGRGECHPQAAGEARTSPMTTTFARLMAGRGGALAPSCARDCHAVGERGVDDGGFAAVQRALSIDLPAHGGPELWAQLPRPLRRLGGVGCTGCHGPAAIPLPGAAATVLRADVCAVCHDAPPRYGHVAAWRRTRMSRADADERTRAGRCARCHTTAGFLAWQRHVPPRAPSADAPAATVDVDYPYVATGVSCAACHDPHDGSLGPGLLRAVEPPSVTPSTAPWDHRAFALCLPCHAPDPFPGPPSASAAAIVLGRGGVAVDTGAPLVGDAPHGALPGGCLGCHDGGADATGRGQRHTFRADPNACERAGCHADSAPREAGPLAARARALLAELAGRLGVPAAEDAPHAAEIALAADSPLARAYYDVALVVEDPAAAYHNPAYARALLDEVERWLAATGR